MKLAKLSHQLFCVLPNASMKNFKICFCEVLNLLNQLNIRYGICSLWKNKKQNLDLYVPYVLIKVSNSRYFTFLNVWIFFWASVPNLCAVLGANLRPSILTEIHGKAIMVANSVQSGTFKKT